MAGECYQNLEDVTARKLDDNDVITDIINIRVSIPDLKTQTTIQVDSTEIIWNIKQRLLATVATALKDGLNYGLFCPESSVRAGKFLSEERCIKDYCLSAGCLLELKYKKREYKNTTNIKPRKLTEINSKTYQKRFLHYISTANIPKIEKFLTRGLDPNFQDAETGETPLTLAVSVSQPLRVMMTLVEGGAHVDYRNLSGQTPIHKAALTGRCQPMKALLDLGASPNSKDSQGLTALYLCVSNSLEVDVQCVEMLLRDYAQHGIQDDAGSAEIHQVCRQGRTQQLEHLLYFGADINLTNKTGNTALHVCALNNQEDCARMLLFRGIDKTIVNFANQDAAQLATICGHEKLATLIENFRSEDVVLYKDRPRYNSKRRSAVTQSSRLTSPTNSLLRMHKLSHSSPMLDSPNRSSRKLGQHNDNVSMVSGSTVSTIGREHRLVSEDSQCQDSDSIDSFTSDMNNASTTKTTTAIYEEIPSSMHLTPHSYSNNRSSYSNVTGSELVNQLTAASRKSSPGTSPYSTLHMRNRKSLEDGIRDDKTASIRSYPKRMVPSIFGEDIFNKPSDSASDQLSMQRNFHSTPDLLADSLHSTPDSLDTSGAELDEHDGTTGNWKVRSLRDVINTRRVSNGSSEFSSGSRNSLTSFQQPVTVGKPQTSASRSSSLDNLLASQLESSSTGCKVPRPPPPPVRGISIPNQPQPLIVYSEHSSGKTTNPLPVPLKKNAKKFGSVDNLFENCVTAKSPTTTGQVKVGGYTRQFNNAEKPPGKLTKRCGSVDNLFDGGNVAPSSGDNNTRGISCNVETCSSLAGKLKRFGSEDNLLTESVNCERKKKVPPAPPKKLASISADSPEFIPPPPPTAFASSPPDDDDLPLPPTMFVFSSPSSVSTPTPTSNKSPLLPPLPGKPGNKIVPVSDATLRQHSVVPASPTMSSGPVHPPVTTPLLPASETTASSEEDFTYMAETVLRKLKDHRATHIAGDLRDSLPPPPQTLPQSTGKHLPPTPPPPSTANKLTLEVKPLPAPPAPVGSRNCPPPPPPLVGSSTSCPPPPPLHRVHEVKLTAAGPRPVTHKLQPTLSDNKQPTRTGKQQQLQQQQQQQGVGGFDLAAFVAKKAELRKQKQES